MLRQREAGGLVGAVLAHGVAMLSVYAVPLQPSVPHEPADVGNDVELESKPQEPRRATGPDARIPSSATGARATHARREAMAGANSAAPTPSEPTPSSIEGPRPTAAFPATLTNEQLGLGGRNPLMMERLAREEGGRDTVREAGERVERSIHDALEAHDHAAGMDRTGALVAVAEDVARRTDSPLEGIAVFEVTVEPDGTVSAVQQVDTGAHAWAEVESGLAVATRSRSVAMRANGKPLRVMLEVSSRWVLPSGASAARPVSPYVKLDPGAMLQSAGAFSHCLDRVPVALGARFDLADIGARPMRVVHARILAERSL